MMIMQLPTPNGYNKFLTLWCFLFLFNWDILNIRFYLKWVWDTITWLLFRNPFPPQFTTDYIIISTSMLFSLFITHSTALLLFTIWLHRLFPSSPNLTDFPHIIAAVQFFTNTHMSIAQLFKCKLFLS